MEKTVELSRNDTKVLKGIAILCMLVLHLFATKNVNGMFNAFPMINGVPLVYYFGILGDACRPIYLFVTGYAFYSMFHSSKLTIGRNLKRILNLYVNYWIVFFLFIPIGFLIGTFKFNLGELIRTILGLEMNYNGAWWFFQIYIVIVLISPFLIKIATKLNGLLLLTISGGIYVFSHLQIYKHMIQFDSSTLNHMFYILMLFGTSQFSFFIGAIFFKEKIYTKIYNKLGNIKYINTFCLMVFILIFFLHFFIESSIIAPFNGIVFICIFMLSRKSVIVEKTLDYLSNHSTNIWLTHMFFYMLYLPKLTFAPKNPILIFAWLIILCLCSSYVIKFIMKTILSFSLPRRRESVNAYK